MSEDTRCPGCGAPGVDDFMCQHNQLSDAQCPWLIYYHKIHEMGNRETHGACVMMANQNWRDEWSPHSGDWVVLSYNPTNQPPRQLGNGCLLIADPSIKKDFRSAWPDEIAAATRGSIPIKLPVPALKLEAGKYYRTRDGRKVLVEKEPRGGPLFQVLDPRVEVIGGYKWVLHRPDGSCLMYFNNCPEGSTYDLIEEWPADPQGYTVKEYRMPNVDEMCLYNGKPTAIVHVSRPLYILKHKAGAGGKAEPVSGGNSFQSKEEKPAPAVDLSALADFKGRYHSDEQRLWLNEQALKVNQACVIELQEELWRKKRLAYLDALDGLERNGCAVCGRDGPLVDGECPDCRH